MLQNVSLHAVIDVCVLDRIPVQLSQNHRFEISGSFLLYKSLILDEEIVYGVVKKVLVLTSKVNLGEGLGVVAGEYPVVQLSRVTVRVLGAKAYVPERSDIYVSDTLAQSDMDGFTRRKVLPLARSELQDGVLDSVCHGRMSENHNIVTGSNDEKPLVFPRRLDLEARAVYVVQEVRY